MAAAVGLGLLAWFGFMAATRLVDADEGWSLMAATLIADGARPYRDFFMQQMPLVPAVYAGWGAVAGHDWSMGRTLAAVIAAASGWLVFLIARRRTGSDRWALVAAALFAGNALVFTWVPVVKTYGLTVLCLLGAWAVLTGGPAGRLRWAAAGVLGGLAVEARLSAIAVLPFLPFMASGGAWIARRAAGPGWFVAGAAVALFPAGLIWVADPARFTYMNLGYHLHRSGLDGAAAWWQRGWTALSAVGLGQDGGAAGTQLLLLILAAAAAPSGRRWRGPLGFAALLSALCLAPVPAFTQYFCVPVPFIVIAAVDGLAEPAGRWSRRLLAMACVAYAVAIPVEWHRGAVSGWNLIGDDRPAAWSLGAIRRVGAAVDRELAAPGEHVLAWWPGYLVGTRARPAAGMENQFALSAGLRLGPGRNPAWGLPDIGTVAGMIAAGQPRLCVVGGWMVEMPADRVRRHLRAKGYAVVSASDDAEVWRRGPAEGISAARPSSAR